MLKKIIDSWRMRDLKSKCFSWKYPNMLVESQGPWHKINHLNLLLIIMTYQNNCHRREVLTTCRLLACCSCCLNFSPIIFLGWESIQNFSSHEQLCSNRIIQCEFQFSWEPIVFFKACQDYTHLKRQIQKIYAQNFFLFLNAFFFPLTP